MSDENPLKDKLLAFLNTGQRFLDFPGVTAVEKLDDITDGTNLVTLADKYDLCLIPDVRIDKRCPRTGEIDNGMIIFGCDRNAYVLKYNHGKGELAWVDKVMHTEQLVSYIEEENLRRKQVYSVR